MKMGITCSWISFGFENGELDKLSPGIARPNNTPASARTAAGDLESGGPGREFRFSKVSGAPRFAVRIMGILALASSFATCV